MNRSLLVWVIVVVALTTTGCQHESADATVVKFWGMGNEGEMVRTLIPEFERTHPGIRITVQQIPWTAAHEKLLTAFAGESTPDIAQLGNTWLPEFTTLGALEPLDERVRLSATIQREDYFDGVLRTNVIDSVLYGIPWYVDTRLLYYRRDLLQKAGFPEPPATWDEMLRLCETMKRQAATDGMRRYPMFLPTNEWVPAILLGMQAGGEFLVDRNTRANFSGPRFRRAMELLASFYRKDYSPIGQSLITNMYDSFSDGLITMYITGPWNIGEFTRRVPAHLSEAWMTAPVPSLDTVRPGISLPLGTSLVLFRQSKQKDAAWQFMEFLASREQSIAFYRITGNLPPRKSAWEDSSLRRNPHIQAFHKQLLRLEPLPQVPEWEQIVIKLQAYVEFVASNAMSVEEATRRLDRDVDRMLEKRRWLLEQGGTR